MKLLYSLMLFFLPVILSGEMKGRNTDTFFDLTKEEVEEHMQDFLERVYFPLSLKKTKMMGASDMFTLYLSLKLTKPNVVIESAHRSGYLTDLIRKTLGDDCIILCLGLNDPSTLGGKRDKNEHTIYKVGEDRVDFSDIDLKAYLSMFSKDKIFAIFYDRVNALERSYECLSKGIKYAYFYENFPLGAGSHKTLEHLINTEDTDLCLDSDLPLNKRRFLSFFKRYHLFPNIFKSLVNTLEGSFSCKYLLEETEENIDLFPLFFKDRAAYRWGTFVEWK